MKKSLEKKMCNNADENGASFLIKQVEEVRSINRKRGKGGGGIEDEGLLIDHFISFISPLFTIHAIYIDVSEAPPLSNSFIIGKVQLARGRSLLSFRRLRERG